VLGRLFTSMGILYARDGKKMHKNVSFGRAFIGLFKSVIVVLLVKKLN